MYNASLEKLEINPKDIKDIVECQKVPNEEVIVETITALKG
jgi:hypothetical protein